MAEELPGYTELGTGALKTEHEFFIRNNKAKAWLTLKLRSRATEAKFLPVYCDGDSVTGEVVLDLESDEKTKGITLTLRGSITETGQDEEFFLEKVVDLWKAPDGASSGVIKKGRHTLPILVPIPSHGTNPRNSQSSFPLPPTFSERASPAYINYQVSVSLKKGGFTPNRKLASGIAYLPRKVAGRPSPMRSLAYEKGTTLPGPSEDPAGWDVLPPVTVEGKLYNDRSVSVEYTLAVAEPMSYASNSPLPVFLTLKSTDKQALDLLSTAPDVRLVRTLALGGTSTERRSNNTFLNPIARASLWPREKESGELERVLQGEVSIPSGVKQSFVANKVALYYDILLMQPKIAGFAPSATASGSIASHTIEITSAPAPGVQMRSFLPPDYQQPEAYENFNIATGLLENGNFRFLHHAGVGATA
ncbi:hypothetical protein PENSPDRAFT_656964 [Peniophora sp. CONT]|nr:hypothetical protein PENSPDRAFT_656964 [Peniophora sp. CONT]